MNVENARKVVEHLRNLRTPDVFNMRLWHVDIRDDKGVACGTAGCLAGHIVEVLATPAEKRKAIRDDEMDIIAANLIGLTPEDAIHLFLPKSPPSPGRTGGGVDYDGMTAEDGADMLDLMIRQHEEGDTLTGGIGGNIYDLWQQTGAWLEVG